MKPLGAEILNTYEYVLSPELCQFSQETGPVPVLLTFEFP